MASRRAAGDLHVKYKHKTDISASDKRTFVKQNDA